MRMPPREELRKIPAASPPANDLRVRVLSLVNPAAIDDSDGDFAVTP